MSYSYVLGLSDMFFLYLKPLPRQYKLNQEKCSFFPTISGVVMPTDTWQLCCASKTTDKSLDSNNKTQAVVIPASPHTISTKFLLLSCVLRPQFSFGGSFAFAVLDCE